MEHNNPLASKPTLNTIEDNRWQIFQSDARRRRLIAFGGTTVAIATGMYFQSVWIFLAGEAGLWLALRTWRVLKK
ncbi:MULTISPECIES: hypothetical protein [Cyanophyceae]|uniref:hypothetical protein n=1 Tax=Cyanophyceae TaxID=3028117 RepID=UPI00016DCECE|nr:MULTISPECIES: hypothetical protein [Cyanophyceae]ACB00981.1 hypothetical protein SYNPCC7002_F0050 [Picosynechococcus sp. PCC 7002]SMH58443.1 hypothetical protein SAMN06272755_3189 [Picosynechococcus sp. OG1]SMQ86437.1 hypothetical protein SAMN06272774_3181 [Synechococcus sp. 7002]